MKQLITLTDAEFEALLELHHLDYVVYLWLRKYMDFGTGIVGLSRGISRQMLLERTYVPETRGRGREATTVSALRESIGRLIGRGLLGRYGNGQKLIFRMPMAHAGYVRPKEQQPRNSRETADHQQPEQQPCESQYWQGLGDYLQPEQQPRNSRPENTEQQPTSSIRESRTPSSSSSNHTDARTESNDGDDDSLSDIPDPPAQAGQWLMVFNRRYGHAFDPASLPVRKRWWPIWTGWVDAGVTMAMVDDSVRQARQNARETIVDMVAYVDRVLASQGSARVPMGRAAGRRATVAGLTSSTGGGYGAIDSTATRMD